MDRYGSFNVAYSHGSNILHHSAVFVCCGRRFCPALKECLKSSAECLPALKQVRYRVWPYVQEQIGWPHKAWEPQDFHPQVAKVQMHCMHETNYTLYLMHVWKAAGWATMDNLKAVGKDYVEIPSLQDIPKRAAVGVKIAH